MNMANNQRAPFKIWYTGSQIDWTLEQIVWAEDASSAIDFIRNNYPWAVVVDWMKSSDSKEGWERTHDLTCVSE
jgi:hypothetical protein